ncbi:MAG: hypothetical protein ABJB55_01810 [Actinomycetota bacterium]
MVTVNVTDPAGTVVTLGVITHWFSVTATFSPPVAAPVELVVELVVEELDPEQAVAITSTDAGITTAHVPLLKNFNMSAPSSK